jgi:hypothetical protein
MAIAARNACAGFGNRERRRALQPGNSYGEYNNCTAIVRRAYPRMMWQAEHSQAGVCSLHGDLFSKMENTRLDGIQIVGFLQGEPA